MSKTKVEKFDENINLDSVLSINYNFDLLKQILSTLLKNQQSYETKLSFLEQKIYE